MGKVKQKAHGGYVVKSLVEGGRECAITLDDHPKMIKELTLSTDQLSRVKDCAYLLEDSTWVYSRDPSIGTRSCPLQCVGEASQSGCC